MQLLFLGTNIAEKKIKYLILFFICFINALYGSEAVSSALISDVLSTAVLGTVRVEC